MIIILVVRMGWKKNKGGFQQFGRILADYHIPEFKPGLKWRGADLQTLCNTIRGPALSLTTDYRRVSFDVAGGQSLRAAYHPSSQSDSFPLIVIIHGLAGDEQSPNVVSTAACFCSLGFPVLRLNLRGAGPSAKTSAGPYHGGLSADLSRVVDQLSRRDYGAGIVLYGISLGANMMLKYLGERGVDAPIRAAVAVSSPLDLKNVQRRIMASRNRIHHNYLLLGMKKYAREMAEHHDTDFLEKALAAKSLLEFDDQVTAPANGMSGAEEYYRLNSAQAFLDGITVPTLLVHARNDPWIPVADYERRSWPDDGAISLVITDDGGHVGFHGIGHKTPWHDRVAAGYLDYILLEGVAA